MPRSRATALAAAFALALAAPPALTAQTPLTFTVGAFGGVYFPAANLFDETFPGVATLSFGHKTGFSFGARLGLWPSRKLGIEAEGLYSLSDVDVNGFIAGDTTLAAGTLDANSFFGSLNIVWVVIDPPLEPVAVYLSGGVGLVSRGGDFYNNALFDDAKSDVAGVFGVGLRYGVGRNVRIRVDVRDYISSFESKTINDIFNQALGTSIGSKLQNDIMVNVGVEIPLGTG